MADAQPQDPNEPSTRERLERAKTLALRARRYWKGAFFVLFLISAASIAFALQIKRIYASECVVLVKPALRTEEQESAQEKAVRLAPKLKDTLLTRSRLEPIIREFHLYPRTVETKSIVDAVDEMSHHIGFKGRDSETFVISFEDEDAERARVITQRLAETTMEDFRRANMSSSQLQADFLSGELSRAEQDLEEANHGLASFLAQHPEFASAANNSPFTPRNGQQGTVPPAPAMPAMPVIPTTSDPQLATLYRERARIESEMKALAQAPAPAPNETITSLTRARDDAAKRAAQAQADLAEKRTRLTDQHPDMIAAKAQADSAAAALRNADAQLEGAKRAAGVPAAPGGEMQSKLADVNRQIANRQAEMARSAKTAAAASTPPPAPSGAAGAQGTLAASDPLHPMVALETEWARLLRAVGDARAAQEDIRRRSERARLKASATEAASGQMEIIDPAYKPISPKKGRRNAAMAGLAFAVLAAAAYAAARVLMNDTLYDPADVQALKLVPVLGVIPRLPPSPMGAAGASAAMTTQGGQGVSRVG